MQVGLVSAALVLLFVLLWQKLQLGLVRYFDVDELAYLHWAHNLFTGQLPYRDFLFYIPPGFLYILAPLFWIAHGAAILTAGRVVAFVIFCAITTLVCLLFWQVRRNWLALVAGILVVFLPIPADKFLELRPDNLAMALFLGGMVCEVAWFQGRRRAAVWSGLLYGISLMILPKTLPGVAVASFLALFYGFRRHGADYIAGLVIPFVLFGVWIIGVARSWGDWSMIIYSLTRLPLEVNKLGTIFWTGPDLFFYPNGLLYGSSGLGAGLLWNHAVWIFGLLVWVVRLMTPFTPRGKKGIWTELLIAGSLLVFTASFLFEYLMRNEQYLIPIAIFVAFYASDGLTFFWQASSGRFRTASFIVFLMLFWAIYRVNTDITRVKMSVTDTAAVETLRTALTVIPKGAYVFDLTGATIYFRDPYYVSAVPFEQWEQFLSRPLPPLIPTLEATRTRYVYVGNRLDTLSPEHQEYIKNNFIPLSDTLLVRK